MRNTIASRNLLSLLLLISASCHKIGIEQNDLKNGFADNKTCVIKSFDRQLADPMGSPSHYVFTYDSKKNPVAITPDVVGSGSPIYRFYYDKKGRLISMVQGFQDNIGFQLLDNYSYDEHDRIIGDSSYSFGTIGQLPGHGMTYFSSFVYDSLNRISVATTNTGEQPFFPPRVIYLNYDPAGNLIYPGQHIQYDNKANLLLTNKIWRFLNWNYSVNNPVGALAYNEHGLPILFPSTNSLGDFTLIGNELVQGSSITYDCQGDLIPDNPR